jgi:hypothetical protein
MAIATEEAIRDRVIAIIEGLTPSSRPVTPKFLRYRNEGDGNFVRWAEASPAAALRRFQVRDDGRDGIPEVSNTDVEDARLLLIIEIAYPQDSRSGPAAALDRDDTGKADWKKINFAIGICGRANFSGANDCTPTGAIKRVEQRNGIDLVVIEAGFRFYRSTS